MSESSLGDRPDPVDPEGWFDDGNYRYRFVIEPARFAISRVLAAESKTNSTSAKEMIENRNSRARLRAVARDARWQVVLLRESRDTLIQRPVVVLAELVASPEAGRARCFDVLRSWQPSLSFLDVEPVGFRELRHWVARTPGTGTLALRLSANAPRRPEAVRPVRWWARADGTVPRLIATAFVGPAVAALTWDHGIPVAFTLAVFAATCWYVGYGWALGINRRHDR